MFLSKLTFNDDLVINIEVQQVAANNKTKLRPEIDT
jgi:hypothetical protein